GLVAEIPADGGEMLASIAQVEQNLGAERIWHLAFDQRAIFRNVAKADLVVAVAEIDFTHPYQWVTPFGAAGVGYGIIVIRLGLVPAIWRGLVLAREQRHFRKTAMNHIEQEGIAFLWFAVDAGLM